jgi:hypothetical protein
MYWFAEEEEEEEEENELFSVGLAMKVEGMVQAAL